MPPTALIPTNSMLLLQLLAGAHINDLTPQKSTALHIAAAHDRANISAALLSEHINYDAVDDALNNGINLSVNQSSLEA